MSTTKSISISEEVEKELGRIKEAGETYNDLLQRMIHAYNRRHLAEKAGTARKMLSEEADTIDDISERSKMGKYVTVNLIFTLAVILIGVGASWALIIMMADGPSSHKLFIYSYLYIPFLIFSLQIINGIICVVLLIGRSDFHFMHRTVLLVLLAASGLAGSLVVYFFSAVAAT